MPIGDYRFRAARGLLRFGPLLMLLAIPACGWLGDLLLQPTIDDVLSGIDRVGPDPGPPTYTPQAFVNWESPHVHPLALSPDGTRLFAVNTPAARLEVFQITDTGLSAEKAVPVGLDPVSVRARTANEAWVVNSISDSVSVVDVSRGVVIQTLQTDDEPTDLIFSNGRAFVVCRQRNLVQVFDLVELSAPPQNLAIAGLHPRAAALSPDGKTVYVAIFESGNETTILKRADVSDPSGPYGGENPIPNRPEGFTPSTPEDAPTGPPTGLIVRRDPATGRWLDERNADWSRFVTWAPHGHDVAAIDTQTLGIRYIPGLMNLNMQLAVRPDGALIVVGTEAFNQIRFEPNLTGQFVRSRLAIVPDGSGAPQVLELNPHLLGVYDTAVKVVAPEVRALSIADPRALAWSSDGGYGYVAGMGSNNVAVIDPAGTRLATFDVGQGPTGLALDEPRGLLYVFNRFDATIQTIDTQTFTTTQVTAIYDPTPQVIRSGRPFLYNARQTSGLGVTACGACHVDGRMDQLAWDLGAPHEPVKAFDQVCDDITEGLLPDAPPCNDFHPIKGPMVTQTLQGIIGTEPLHWRGDRADLAAFNPAFVTLNGNDRELAPEEMAAFEAFLATVTFPPNPNRSRDNSLKRELDGGNPQRGREIYLREPIDTATGRLHGAAPLVRDTVERIGPILTCNRCHHLPSGTNGLIISKVDLLSEQAIKVPQLRNIHEKAGFDRGSTSNHSGFGFAHDGSFGTLEDFFDLGVFDFGSGEEGAQRLRDVIAFLHSLGVDTHAGVGTQVTLTAANALAPAVVERIEIMMQMADGGQVGLVVHGTLEGALRGLAYRGAGRFQADGAGDTWTTVQLWEAAIGGEAQTWTTVPLGSEERLGVDPNDHP